MEILFISIYSVGQRNENKRRILENIESEGGKLSIGNIKNITIALNLNRTKRFSVVTHGNNNFIDFYSSTFDTHRDIILHLHDSCKSMKMV
jgi:hypothetical protein